MQTFGVNEVKMHKKPSTVSSLGCEVIKLNASQGFKQKKIPPVGHSTGGAKSYFLVNQAVNCEDYPILSILKVITRIVNS